MPDIINTTIDNSDKVSFSSNSIYFIAISY